MAEREKIRRSFGHTKSRNARLKRKITVLRKHYSDSKAVAEFPQNYLQGLSKYSLRPRGSLSREAVNPEIEVKAKIMKTTGEERQAKLTSPSSLRQSTNIKKLSGEALETFYDQYVNSFEERDLPEGIKGFQLNDLQDIVYVYVEKGKKREGDIFVNEDKDLGCLSNVQVVEISGGNDLTCLNCNTVACDSLSGSLDVGPKPWIGLGSTIVALQESEWREISAKREYSTITEVTKILKQKRVTRLKWSVGCHLLTENYNQVAITSYHSLIHFQTQIPLVFLTEVSINESPMRTQVKVLCNEYIHQDPATLNQSKIGQYDLGKGHNILVLKINEDVIDLLRNKLKECDSAEKQFILVSINTGDLGYNDIVGKRGSTTGLTYSQLIARKVNLESSARRNTLTSAFAVGSIGGLGYNTVPFAKPGDSGSLVFKKDSNADSSNDDELKLYGHGLIWRNQELKNNRTGEMDPHATACSKLNVNLATLDQGPYQNLRVPPADPSTTIFAHSQAECASTSTA